MRRLPISHGLSATVNDLHANVRLRAGLMRRVIGDI